MSGQKCIEVIKSGKNYDLIFMDDMMPEMNGIETMEKLKQIENFNIPIIVHTANAIIGVEEEYLEKGFDGYISKPIDRDLLDQILNKFLFDSGD